MIGLHRKIDQGVIRGNSTCSQILPNETNYWLEWLCICKVLCLEDSFTRVTIKLLF